jgi:hypothetical protein
MIEQSVGASEATTGGPGKAFLDHFPDHARSWAMSQFLDQIRTGGPTTPAGVATAVAERARAQADEAERRRQWTDVATWSSLFHAVRGYRAQAEALAGAALEWEALPPAERARQKAARAEAGRRAWMAGQPPTEKQLAFLRALGYCGPVANRAEASQLIDRLRGPR